MDQIDRRLWKADRVYIPHRMIDPAGLKLVDDDFSEGIFRRRRGRILPHPGSVSADSEIGKEDKAGTENTEREDQNCGDLMLVVWRG